jgi:hypothetical protein
MALKETRQDERCADSLILPQDGTPGAAWKRGLALMRLDVCGTPREALTRLRNSL